MSTEEDTELRDLVAQTLEVNGCLPKIRAELRASIFLALDEDDELQRKEPLLNKKVKSTLELQEGRTMFCLVREFLEFYNLDFTVSVYEPESYLGRSYQYGGRSKVIEDLKIPQLKENSTLPLLLQLIQIAQVKSAQQAKNIDINLTGLQSDRFSSETSDNSSALEQPVVLSEPSVLKALGRPSGTPESSGNGPLNPQTEIHQVSRDNLNETFEMSSPSANLKSLHKLGTDQDVIVSPRANLKSLHKFGADQDVILSPRSIESSKSTNEDDTFDSTSSIAEDSVKDQSVPNFDKSPQSSEKSLSETEFSPPVLKDSKSHSKFDVSYNLKLSPQKADKLKAKGSLSSLADLPPLQLSKSRNDTLLLPSLYSKEFKERASNQNLREIDKLFDVDSMDNYEEDFMSESEMNLNKSLESVRNAFLDDLQSSSFTDSNKNITSPSIKSAENKNLSNKRATQTFERFSNQNMEKSKTESPKSVSGTSSVTSDDLNLNINDILNSPTSN